MFTWQAGQMAIPNRSDGRDSSPHLNISNLRPQIPWFGVVLKHLTSINKRICVFSCFLQRSSYFSFQGHFLDGKCALFQSSPQHRHRNLHFLRSPSACLTQWMLQHPTVVLAGRQGESRLLPQGGGLPPKKAKLTTIDALFLRQQQMPADLKGVFSLSCLTPVEGRAAQMWPSLSSGSCGSSSTKPLTSYLYWWTQEYGLLKFFIITRPSMSSKNMVKLKTKSQSRSWLLMACHFPATTSSSHHQVLIINGHMMIIIS